MKGIGCLFELKNNDPAEIRRTGMQVGEIYVNLTGEIIGIVKIDRMWKIVSIEQKDHVPDEYDLSDYVGMSLLDLFPRVTQDPDVRIQGLQLVVDSEHNDWRQIHKTGIRTAKVIRKATGELLGLVRLDRAFKIVFINQISQWPFDNLESLHGMDVLNKRPVPLELSLYPLEKEKAT